MKKTAILLVLVGLMMFTIGMTVFAEEVVEPTTVYDEANGYTTSGANEAYADKLVTILAISGENITIDSIQYIGQSMADENGEYSFTNYLPKNDPVNEAYKVLIGGEEIDTPLDAGIIGKYPGVSISGTVSVTGADKSAEILITKKDDPTISKTTEADPATGEYLIDDVEKGIYTVHVSKKSNLKYTLNNLNVQSNIVNNDYQLFAGDVNQDDKINILDITQIVSTFNGDTSVYPNSDVDNNGAINILDILAAVNNFNKASVIEDR